MFSEAKVTEIYCLADDFCKEFARHQENYMLKNTNNEGLATRGKCSMEWFFGFKLHLIINDKGEILNFMFTAADVDDRKPLKQKSFLNNIKGKLCADKGYIGKTLFETLFLNGIQLITKIKNNMKNVLMNINDKILIRKRAVIETVKMS